MAVLVVGGDSLIGGALLAGYAAGGVAALGTTRRREAAGPGRPWLDLAEDPERWRPPAGITLAFLAAGVTSLDSCRRDPVASRRVNVEALCLVAERLAQAGAFIVFYSTNLVFDGRGPGVRAEAPLVPTSQYGRQKAEAETRLLATVRDLAVIRLTEVLGPRPGLLGSWLESLRAGQIITPFADMFFSPIPLSLAVTVSRLVGEAGLRGVMQVSGERDLSYAQAGEMAARLAGADPALVRPVRAMDSGLVGEPPPRHTTLDTEGLRSKLGLTAPAVEWTLRAGFLRPQTLAGAWAHPAGGEQLGPAR